MKKTRRKLLDPVWSEALLSVPSEHSKEKTVAELLNQLRSAYESSVEEAVHVVSNHPFAEVIAAEAAKRAGWRGAATLEVSPEDGHIYLVVTGKGAAKSDSGTIRDWQSELPSIGELREEAESLGIDPAPFGRGKRKLLKAIEAKKSVTPKKRGFRKTSVAVSETKVVPVNKTKTNLSQLVSSADEINLDDF